MWPPCLPRCSSKSKDFVEYKYSFSTKNTNISKQSTFSLIEKKIYLILLNKRQTHQNLVIVKQISNL
jgi:hypothetical protein